MSYTRKDPEFIMQSTKARFCGSFFVQTNSVADVVIQLHNM